MLRHHAALVSGKRTRVTSGVNLPPSEVIMSSRIAQKMTVIAFATYEDSGGFTSDDHQLVLALRERGVAVEPVVWDDPHIDWRRFPLVVIRSVWDYHLKANRFREWVSTFLEHPGQLWNPPAAVLGNMNKGYLLDLAAAGHSVVPTTYVAAGSGLKLKEIIESHGWTQAVIKPAVSAGAMGAWKCSLAEADADQGRFAQSGWDGDLLVQEYLDEILQGEWSFVFLAGEFSHAVLKEPPDGDFRLQNVTAKITAMDPSDQMVNEAKEILTGTQGPLLYARVDAVETEGRLVVMELEINEPYLFLSYSTEAPVRFAEKIIAMVERTG
jgi:glutathione synthase/RimK-type ligase-like ATP-grasp enzyme